MTRIYNNKALSSAFLQWAMRGSGYKRDDVYRLFLSHPGWDYDLDTEDSSAWPFGPLWLIFCPNSFCFQLILHSQTRELSAWSVEDKFELLYANHELGYAQFLDCIGLTQTDQRLAKLKTRNGYTLLHHVAFHCMAHSRPTQQWLNLGKALIRWGADTSAIESSGYYTPLKSLIQASQHMGPDRLLSHLRLWIQMLQEAGIDLEEYGAKESQIWEPVDGHEVSIESFTYGPASADWNLVGRWKRTVSIYRLLQPPGTFHISNSVPDKILWRPGCVELAEEGHWAKAGTFIPMSPTVDMRNMFTATEEHFHQLCRSSQDDSGTIMLLCDRAASRPLARTRSPSQPPCLKRREVDYLSSRSVRAWLPPVHYCPSTLHWSFEHRELPSEWRWDTFCNGEMYVMTDLRRCTRDSDGGESHSVCEYDGWWYQWWQAGFLNDVYTCQSLDFESEKPCGRYEHSKTQECIWGCSKVDLDKLAGPLGTGWRQIRC